MPSFKEGCVVMYRPTQSLYTVVRWDQDAEVLLLTPAVRPSTVSHTTATKERRARTRWVFEKMVDVVEKSTAPTDGVMTTSATAAGTAAPTKHSGKAKASTSDPNPYARRAAKLDRRVEFSRRHPKRGRGLFALRDLPAGTEVMRVPAVAAVLSGRGAKDSCAGCFLSMKAVGQLNACQGCPLRFCARCKKEGIGGGGVGHNNGTCELTKGFIGIRANNTGGSGSPNEGLLRLVADLLVRRRAGVISDEEWDLLKSLESRENEARTMGLSPSEIQKCARLLKSLVGIDVSHEDFQAMYRRVTRNVHTVSPNTTAYDPSSVASVEGLFPCGALVNHSCLPNSFFHCVTGPSSSAGGPPVVEQVLRTTRNVRAGDELCYSYLSAIAAKTVSQRRVLLEGWGFRCACERCQREVEEDARRESHPTPLDVVALQMVRRLGQIMDDGQRNALALKEEEYGPDLERVAEFLVMERERGLSPFLASRIAIDLFEVTMLVGFSDPLFRFAVCGFAAEWFSRIGSPSEIYARLQQYAMSTRVELSARQSKQSKNVRTAGMDAFHQAVQLHALLYGEEHETSVRLRQQVEAAVRRSR